MIRYKKEYLSKLFNLIGLLLNSAMLVTACAADSTSSTSVGEQTFDLETLARYDGQDGRRAYIAVDGVVYDVTDIPQWQDGVHQGRFSAGKDYSDAIRSESPHGTSMLSRAEVVGVLVD